MSKPMTEERLSEIERENLKVWGRVRIAKVSGHVFSPVTVESDCQVCDELIAEVRRLHECIAKAPEPHPVYAIGFDNFKKWQRQALGEQ